MEKGEGIMKIGLIGGTFNPIHYGHLILSEFIREEMDLDRIIFIPTRIPPHKDSSNIPNGKVRIEMVNLAIKSNENFQSSTIEIDREGVSYTIDTIEELKSKYPQDEFFFIIGEDSLFQLHNWKDYERLIKICNIIVAERIGQEKDKINDRIYEINSLFNGNIVKASSPHIGISSTIIRNRVKNGLSIKYLVPETVEEYIINNGLYLGEESND